MANTCAVSVLILTYNEEENIGRCLDSVAWCDDVIVLDSHSTDATEQISKTKGAQVFHRVFDNYAAQRNYGLKDLTYKYDWLLMLDADETVPEDLYREIETVLANVDEQTALYRMRRKDYLFGNWIKYSTSFSSLWFGRLMRVGHVWVEREVNEEYHTEGKIDFLSNALEHYPFNKGFHAWLEKHNRYSTMEAQFKFKEGNQPWQLSDFWHSDPATRRKALKAIVYSLPGRPFIMFFGRYLIARGFLDGRSGFKYCMLKSFYEYMIDCKLKEFTFRKRNLPL